MPTTPVETRSKTRARRRAAFVVATRRHRVSSRTPHTTGRHSTVSQHTTIADHVHKVRARRRRRVHAFFNRRRVSQNYTGGNDSAYAGVASRTTPSTGA